MKFDFGIKGSEFFRIFIWIFFGTGFVFMLIGGLMGLMAALLLSLLITPVIMFVTGNFANLAGIIYTGGGSTLSEDEKLAGEIDKVQYSLRSRYFDRALEQVNQILDQKEDHAEALYLKACIIRRGFHDSSEAISCCRKLLVTTDPKDRYYRWGLNLLNELTGNSEVKGDDDQ